MLITLILSLLQQQQKVVSVVMLFSPEFVMAFRNPSGWGNSAIDLLSYVVTQTIAASIIFAVFFIGIFLTPRLRFITLSLWSLWAMWVIGLLFSLPVLSWLWKRPINYVDGIQTIILLIVGCALISRLLIKWGKDNQSPPNTQPYVSLGKPPWLNELDEEEQRLFNNLMVKVLGDRQKVIRLLDFEQKLRPGLSRKQYMRNAIGRWEYDNQR